uniref:Neurotensin/neuromedin N n=1 Tax=Oryzias sinensis TaxID=183150 RepID=A0A8C7XUM9_9TELE
MEPTALHIQPGNHNNLLGQEEKKYQKGGSATGILQNVFLSVGFLLFPSMMQLQVACMLLLCFTGGTLCTVAEQNQEALAQELISSLLTSKIRHEWQSAPYWHSQLSSLCKLVSGLQEGPWSREEEEGEEGEVREGSLQLLEELFSLQHVCRALQSREERLLYDSLEDNSDVPLKRKSPYILKRQAGPKAKSRRPYILKRRTVY